MQALEKGTKKELDFRQTLLLNFVVDFSYFGSSSQNFFGHLQVRPSQRFLPVSPSPHGQLSFNEQLGQVSVAGFFIAVLLMLIRVSHRTGKIARKIAIFF